MDRVLRINSFNRAVSYISSQRTPKVTLRLSFVRDLDMDFHLIEHLIYKMPLLRKLLKINIPKDSRKYLDANNLIWDEFISMFWSNKLTAKLLVWRLFIGFSVGFCPDELRTLVFPYIELFLDTIYCNIVILSEDGLEPE